MSQQRGHAAAWLGVSFVVIVLFAASPLISALLAGGAADVLGCSLNEGGGAPCPFMGVDLREPLATMLVLGWLAFETLPIGLAALSIWLVVACVLAFLRWHRRQRQA